MMRIAHRNSNAGERTPRRAVRNIIMLCLLLVLFVTVQSDCRRYAFRQIMTGRKLEGINLSGVDFYNMDLENINLNRAKLVKANFSFANLKNAKMINADLREADLSGADLTGADLRGANFRGANLQNSFLRKANLVDTYFYDADLSRSDMRDAFLVAGIPDDTDMAALQAKIQRGEINYYVHLRNADLAGTAISVRWKAFIASLNTRNYDKIVWVK
jgi:uncharacterized protein YjbI with pentapeptide repeats